MKKLIPFLFVFSGCASGQIPGDQPLLSARYGINKPQHFPPIVINDYIDVRSFDICKNEMIVSDASRFYPGDTVLIIQMKGARIDTTNSVASGTITDYGNAGNYEFNYIAQKAGNLITFRNKITRSYDVPDGFVQLVRVPYYTNAGFIEPLTCDPWDGFKGGVLVLNAKSVYLQEFIDVNGKGFFGGSGFNSGANALTCTENNYNYPASHTVSAFKGESIAVVPPSAVKGRGSPAGGGGGGLGHNSGGGGGGNGGVGGTGGYQSDLCSGPPADNRGIGGHLLNNSSLLNKVFLGSGGGAGHADDPGNYPMKGGAGGGIIIINAQFFQSNGEPITANGDSGRVCDFFESVNCREGMGGGGSGGTILFNVNQQSDNVTLEARGGSGADMQGNIAAGRLGPGGGGGGGVIFINNGSLPATITAVTAGGKSGVITTDSNNSWGAVAGADGINLFGLALPVDSVLFEKNIDSVRISESISSCSNYDFMGLAYTNTIPIASWQWFFGDGGTANTQNTLHTYTAAGTYAVKLIVTDINGCKDSITKSITVSNVVTADAGNNQSFCSNTGISTSLSGSGNGTNYSWIPAVYLNDPAQQNPIATVNRLTVFYLTVSDNSGCSSTDSVVINVNPVPDIRASKTNDISCSFASAGLQATGGLQYMWTPASTLSNSSISNPVATPASTTTYTVTGTGPGGCINTDTVTVSVSLRRGIFELPNSFTPNGDGLNDCFGFKYRDGIQSIVFHVYNYLGQKIFETANVGDCWEGIFDGKKAATGNYVYYIKANTLCGQVIRQGNVLLIR
jgi:gliding motility-associated-like protein